MKTVCAWCGAHMRGPETAKTISHAICDDCFTKSEAEIMALQNKKDHSIDMGGEG